MTVYVVLPAYNEADNLAPLLRLYVELQRTVPLHCLVVDDGSVDTSGAVAESFAAELPITVIRHTENRGLSRTLETGFRAACERAGDGDVVVCMDADNTHLPSQIPEMLEKIRDGFDVVIASRYRRGSRVEGVSRFRRSLSAAAALLFASVVPIPGVRDFSCGFRAYRVPALRRAIKHFGDEVFALKGFACTAALLFGCKRVGATMTEIPMDLRYQQKRGVSKLALRRTIVESLRLVWRERRRNSLPVAPCIHQEEAGHGAESGHG